MRGPYEGAGIGSGTGWQRAGVKSKTVTALLVKGLLVRNANRQLTFDGWRTRCAAGAVPGL